MAASAKKYFSALHSSFDHEEEAVPTHHVFTARHSDEVRTRGLKGPTGVDAALSHFGGVLHKGLTANTDDELDVGDGCTFQSVEHAKFAEFRRLVGISEADYLQSMSKLSGGKTEASGKSGSLFWFSEDHKYMLKSISEGELDALTDMLPRYVAHFQNAKARGAQCLLSKLLGAYLLVNGSKTIRLIAMNNLMGPNKPDAAYDLKGTTEDRYVEEGDGKVMKDLNYRDYVAQVPAKAADSLHDAIEADSQFLMDENIMDYSLLLGVFDAKEGQTAVTAEPVYVGTEAVADEQLDREPWPAAFRMGIIDILVRYTTKKKLAHVLKKPTLGCCMGQEIDTEPPDYYQSRFSEAMTEKIVPV